jgi:hypothetical protein
MLPRLEQLPTPDPASLRRLRISRRQSRRRHGQRRQGKRRYLSRQRWRLLSPAVAASLAGSGAGARGDVLGT